MRNKLKYIILIICSIFLITGFSLWAINYYLYSWTSKYVTLSGCKNREIGVLNLGKSQYGEDFGEILDLIKLKNDLAGDANYVITMNSYKNLIITRIFDKKKYIITFENLQEPFKKNIEKTMFQFSGGNDEEGEPCTMPAYLIFKNAYLMINDLPLTEKQRERLQSNVTVYSTGGSWMF